MNVLDKVLVKLNLNFLVSGNYFKEDSQMNVGNMSEEIINKRPEIKIDLNVWLLQTIIWCCVVCMSKIVLYYVEVNYSFIF